MEELSHGLSHLVANVVRNHALPAPMSMANIAPIKMVMTGGKATGEPKYHPDS